MSVRRRAMEEGSGPEPVISRRCCPRCGRAVGVGRRLLASATWVGWRCSGCGESLEVTVPSVLVAMIPAVVACPYSVIIAPPLAVLGVVHGLWLARVVMNRHPPWCCRECGYSMRGNRRGMCPECGQGVGHDGGGA
jgi:hypothetical protein